MRPVPDTVAVRVVNAPPDQDARRLLFLVAGIGALQLLVFWTQAWMLRNGVHAVKASTGTIHNNAVIELRAYVNITIDPWVHPSTWRDGDRSRALRVTNSGKTPAKDVRARFEYALFEDTASVRGMTIDGAKPRWGVLGRGEGIDVPLLGAPVPEEQWPLLNVGSGHTMFVYGEVWYADVFGVERRTEFCRHINWRGGEMVSSIPNYGNDFT